MKRILVACLIGLAMAAFAQTDYLTSAQEARLEQLNKKPVPSNLESEGRALKAEIKRRDEEYRTIDYKYRDLTGKDIKNLEKEIEELKNKRDKLHDSCQDLLDEMKDKQESVFKFYRELELYVRQRVLSQNAIPFGVPVFERQKIMEKTEKPMLLIDLSHKGKNKMIITGGEIMLFNRKGDKLNGKAQFVRIHKDEDKLRIYKVGEVIEITEKDQMTQQSVYKRVLFDSNFDNSTMEEGDMVGVVLSTGLQIRFDDNCVTVSKRIDIDDFDIIPSALSFHDVLKDDDVKNIDNPQNTKTVSSAAKNYTWVENIGCSYSFNALVEITVE